MSTPLPIKVSVGRFPLNFNDTPKKKFRALIRRMRGQVTGVIFGQNAGSEPASDAGMWVNGTSIYPWDASRGAYSPMTLLAKSGNFTARAKSAVLTAGRTITFPDKGGTGAHAIIATLADAYIPRPPVLPIVTSGIWTIAADQYESAYGKLSLIPPATTTTIVFTGFPDGKKFVVGILNNGTAFTVTWPAGIVWPGGGEPTQPIAVPGGSGFAIYTIRSVNGTLYGIMDDRSPNMPVQEVTIPDVPANYGNYGGLAVKGHTQKLP